MIMLIFLANDLLFLAFVSALALVAFMFVQLWGYVPQG